MKTANDATYTCSKFRKNLSAFIDDELPEKNKAQFLDHASHCESCITSLEELRQLKKILSNLKSVSVSPEFDFRLSGSIHLENTRLQNPLYRFRLYIQDNMKTFLTVPAIAVLVLGFAYLRSDVYFTNQNKPELTQNTILPTRDDPSIILEETSEEVIYYVLDSVKEGEADTGIFLNEQNNMEQMTPSNNNIKLISF